MKIVCINPYYENNKYFYLTYGRVYYAESVDKDCSGEIMNYNFKNDIGEYFWYDPDRFRLLSDIRDEKLGELGI